MHLLRRPIGLVLGLTLASIVLSGCFLWTTRGEGDDLTSQSRDQEQRIAALETGMEAERAALNKSVGDARTKVAELEELIERATQVVTRNSADLGLEVQNLRQEIARLEGQISELHNQVQQVERRMEDQNQVIQKQLKQAATGEVTLEPADIPGDRTEHYAAAYRSFQNRELAKSRALFRAFVDRYAQDDQADNAQYWVGKSYLSQDRPAMALGEFRKVLSQWPRGDAVDETLFDMADAFYRLQSCADARAALEALIRSHPTSPLVDRARAKLREVQGAPAGHCTS